MDTDRSPSERLEEKQTSRCASVGETGQARVLRAICRNLERGTCRVSLAPTEVDCYQALNWVLC